MVRKAVISDVDGILSLIRPFVEKEVILNKTRQDVIERLRDYFIYETDDKITGCSALYPGWEELGEIRTTAVAENMQGKGIGKELVLACLEEAKSIGIPKIFVLTYETAFFKNLGFKEVDKNTLPHKIFKDCIKCKHFPDCDETAFEMKL